MAKAIEIKVMEMAEPVAQRFGFYIVDVEYKKEGNDRFLRFFIDKEGGVGINDCEMFSRAVEEKLDAEDPIDEAYCLEVSSPGADRILKTEREFLYYIGREVDVKLYSAVDSKKEFTGILKGYSDGAAYIETDGKEIGIPVKQAVYIRLSFRF